MKPRLEIRMPIAYLEDTFLYYKRSGQGDPLILLHGLATNCHDWDDHFETFAQYFDVIAVDLRGHGRSQRPFSSYYIENLADDIKNLLVYLNIPSAYLLGSSLGGMAALQMAIVYPQYVKSLILVNSTPCLRQFGEITFKEIFKNLAASFTFPMPLLARYFAKKVFPYPYQKSMQAKLAAQVRLLRKKDFLKALRAILFFDCREYLQEIRKPTLIISGSDNKIIPPVYAEQLFHSISNSEMVMLPKGGHAPFRESPEAFGRYVIDFLLRDRLLQNRFIRFNS